MPHATKDKDFCWVNLSDEKWTLITFKNALQKAVSNMRDKVGAGELFAGATSQIP